MSTNEDLLPDEQRREKLRNDFDDAFQLNPFEALTLAKMLVDYVGTIQDNAVSKAKEELEILSQFREQVAQYAKKCGFAN